MSLAELESSDPFADRHIGPDAGELSEILSALGVTSLEELLDQVVPKAIRLEKPLDLPTGLSERDATARLAGLAARNSARTSLLGTGYYGTITPPVIQRNILENPAWYTAYTPYQPEISQGRLEALLNFQTMVADLTGMDLANASLLDEATAAAEAMTMCRRLSKHTGGTFFVDVGCHPQTIAVIATRAEPIGITLKIGEPLDLNLDDTFGVLLQQPTTSGVLRDPRAVIAAAHDDGTMVVVAADLLSLLLLESPGAHGADIVVGSAQRFGVPMGFGGPHAGFIATHDASARSLPGRLVGVATDTKGRPALRLALQTREQHIRREKATSNICTAQVLLAVMAGMFAVWHGPEGLRRIATRVHRVAALTAAALRSKGVTMVHEQFFDTIAASVPGRAAEIVARAAARNIDLRLLNRDTVVMSFDELSTRQTIIDVVDAFGMRVEVEDLDVETGGAIPNDLRRTVEPLAHPVFHRHHSEHEMLRYLRRLADADLALDRTMIPLGSCTMKLNATSEMVPITWPSFANIHPFAPVDSTRGFLQMIRELEDALLEVTGYDAISLQPNAGSQGELAGLLAIRAYHRSRGDLERTTCLIPSSAHGTNAASAVMAGMRVVVVACDEHGNVDLDDLRSKANATADRVAVCMVTYPSTHGVFEEGIVELCDIVHAAGGQVYVDGANLNALVGAAKPGWFGGDVSHLNLHKTFCIPHGGGGPGVGPVAAKAHLAPFLPNHPMRDDAGPSTGVGPVSGAPFGSAGILPIPWMYVTMMGADGMARATAVAIANANYLATRLAPHYPVLYHGANGRVAHECILDVRPITKATGVTVDDIAKRLIDHSFHAPTMSFPVAGTLMIEPTESESKLELDRFCTAMIAIRAEISAVANGDISVEESPLRHAPHTSADVATDAWDRAYSRDLAALHSNGKYWPPVSRIDAAYGDRHLVCSCPPIESYQD